MGKKVIFVGMSNKGLAWSHRSSIIHALSDKGVLVKQNIFGGLDFETPHTYVRYILSGDKDEDLIGMQADAVFGSIYDAMKFRMRPGAEQWRNAGMSVYDYVFNVEFDALKDIEMTKEVAEQSHVLKPAMLIEVDTASLDDPDEMLAEVFKYAYTVTDREVRIRVV